MEQPARHFACAYIDTLVGFYLLLRRFASIIYLGLDYGKKRIGVAVSDSLGVTAQPLTVIEAKSFKQNAAVIGALCREHNVSKIVVGYPLNMDGSAGYSAKEAAEFADKLKNKLNIAVELCDERLTSQFAEKILLEADLTRSNRKKVRDKVAAAMILETFLSLQNL